MYKASLLDSLTDTFIQQGRIHEGSFPSETDVIRSDANKAFQSY